MQLNLFLNDILVRGMLSQNGVLFSHVKDPAAKGHLSCSDTFTCILMCPLKIGVAVLRF